MTLDVRMGFLHCNRYLDLSTDSQEHIPISNNPVLQAMERRKQYYTALKKIYSRPLTIRLNFWLS